MAIPLWVPEQVDGETVLFFKPRDLAASIAVSRLFHKYLTPILWTTYAYPADSSHLQLQLHHQWPNPYQELALKTLKKYTNTGLRLLYWDRSDSVVWDHPLSELKSLFPLSQLRTLSLRGWRLDPIYLHRILANNADTLEELDLSGDAHIAQEPTMNPQWSGPSITSLPHMTEERRLEAAQLVQGRSLLLPKVKTLHLEILWDMTSDSTYSLIQAFPALKTLRIGNVDINDGPRLRQVLREFCPLLQSIQNPVLAYSHHRRTTPSFQGMAHVINACKPGNLIHAAVVKNGFDESMRDALLKQGDRLEVLELTINSVDTDTTFKNLRQVLEGCRRLKKFSLFSFVKLCKHQDALLFLDGLNECCELESLALVGFPYKVQGNEDVRDGHDNDDESHRELVSSSNEAISITSGLPPHWRPVPRVVAGANVSPSTLDFRTLVFDGISHLPRLKTVHLDLRQSPSNDHQGINNNNSNSTPTLVAKDHSRRRETHSTLGSQDKSKARQSGYSGPWTSSPQSPSIGSFTLFSHLSSGPRPSRFHEMPSDIVENSTHSRYLNLSLLSDSSHGLSNIKQLQLNCTHLQELTLSTVITRRSFAEKLIQANPSLRLLHLETTALWGKRLRGPTGH
ncbi:MAG: hypothetical protein J3R72DRAFT_492353 [Linnemannia gamsii]|nr:MAG: hypothetical protein J3R72DRAFT_492353 [Linnemannia gamsii]